MGMDAQRKARAPRLLGAILAVGILGALFLPVSATSAQAVVEVNWPNVGAVLGVDIDPNPNVVVLTTVTCTTNATVVPLLPLPLNVCLFVNVNIPGLVVTTITVAVGNCPAYPLNAPNTQLAGQGVVNAGASGPGSPSAGPPEWLVVTAALGLLVAVNAGFVGGIARRRRLTRTI